MNYIKKYSCETEGCRYSTKHKKDMRVHSESVHLRILKYSCNICDYKSYQKQNIQSHQDIKHKNEEAKIIRNGCKPCESNLPHEKHRRKARNKQINAIFGKVRGRKARRSWTTSPTSEK